MHHVPTRSAGRLAAIAFASLLAACSRPEVEPAASSPAAPPQATQATLAPPAPAPPPALSRADLIAAAAAAADAHATGAAYPDKVAALAGKRFETRQPFGCVGPRASETEDGYVIDENRRAMTIQMAATSWSDEAWRQVFSDPGAPAEALEGFWLRRPWITSAKCPASHGVEGPTTGESIGLVRVFAAGGSRIPRRGDRPYRATVKLEPNAPPPPGPLQLVLRGKIADAAGRPIRCRSDGPDQRPVCLVSITLEGVSFETSDGATAAEWKE